MGDPPGLRLFAGMAAPMVILVACASRLAPSRPRRQRACASRPLRPSERSCCHLHQASYATPQS